VTAGGAKEPVKITSQDKGTGAAGRMCCHGLSAVAGGQRLIPSTGGQWHMKESDGTGKDAMVTPIGRGTMAMRGVVGANTGFISWSCDDG